MSQLKSAHPIPKNMPLSAFCSSTSRSPFPTAVPKNYDTNWVWDAVYDSSNHAVELTTISGNSWNAITIHISAV